MNLSILNDKQLAAVTAPLGPVLVLAGAGSGKTRVLTYRIAYIIEQDLFKPDQILAVTFTNKAAKEMQSRVNVLLKESSAKLTSQPAIGTFHSIGVRILRKYIAKLGYNSGFAILDGDDQVKIIKDILKDLNIPKQYAPTLFRAYISGAKNLLQTPANMAVGLEGHMHELVSQVYARYQDFLYKQNSVDFDDLLMLPIILFETFPEILRKFQTLWPYVLVDEYQDTNQAQYMFLHLLANKGNLFVVGDDAQSIYGFRGSNIANILNFEKDFPAAQVIKLEQNYRSTKNILAAAQKVIELNSEQKPKTLWTDNDEGDKVIIEEVFDGRAEAIYVAKNIVKLASRADEAESGGGELEYEEEPEAGYADEPITQTYSILDKFLAKQRQNYKTGGFGNSSRGFGLVPQLSKEHDGLDEIAVLYRTHAQSREIEEVFIEAGIPYQIVGGVKYYERKEIKDVLAYLRLLVNPFEFTSLRRVVNLPPRGIGDKAMDAIREFVLTQTGVTTINEAMTRMLGINLPQRQRESLQTFYGVLHKAQIVPVETTLSELLKVVVKLTGIEDYYRDGTDQGETRIENIKELFNVTSKFDHLPWQEGLQEFLEEVALITDLDKTSDTRNLVTLMTLHAAKGLEFDTVFFVGLEEGVLPHSNSLLDPSELAEEIRLAYVGLTRARKRLFLVYAQSRQMYGSFQNNSPSRILRALPQNVIKAKGNLAALNGDEDDYSYEPFDE
ncbi:UvrD-helicase domain-containing protein [bacterium]|nr:MAG: UvrD-helicase domain-containing protein [bacterium]